jgi:hypothetical protein
VYLEIEGSIIMEKNKTMDCDEAVDYIRNNVKHFDVLELSYNRVFTPGEVIVVEEYDCEDRKSCRITVQIEGDLGQAVELDMEEIKDDLIEIKHIPDGDGEPTIITIEKCET